MQQPSTWEMVLIGAIAVLVILWVSPGIKSLLEQSRESKNRDWAGLLVPIALVILFVMLLIAMV
jgi:hypothetical protein